MERWANRETLPGQFNKSAKVKILSAHELGTGNPKKQAWAKKVRSSHNFCVLLLCFFVRVLEEEIN